MALTALLAACSSVTERDYEACIVGSSALGGLAGAASGGALAGIAVGAGAGAIICSHEPPAAKPMAAAPAAVADGDGDGVPDDRDRCP